MRVAPFRQSRIYARETLGCLGSPFVSFNLFITGHSPERAFASRDFRLAISTSAVFRWVYRCRRFRDAAAGVVLHHWKPGVLHHFCFLLGFNQFRFGLSLLRDFMHTGLAALHITSLHVSPLSHHAPFPFGFPRQVGWVS